MTSIQDLVDMGFSMDKAQRAVQRTAGDFGQALELLLSGVELEDASPPPPPPPSSPGPAANAQQAPSAFLCPLTSEVMTDPVFTCDGHSFERRAIQEWLQSNNVSPVTRAPLEHKNLVPNIQLRLQIQEFLGSASASTSPAPVPQPTTPRAAPAPRADMGPPFVREVWFEKGTPAGLDLDENLRVKSVVLGSQADTQRIQINEFIALVNGSVVVSAQQLQNKMRPVPPGTNMLFVFTRPVERTFIKGPTMGLTLSDAMVVEEVEHSTQAFTQRIKIGSRIVALDGRPITMPQLSLRLRQKPTGSTITFTFTPPIGDLPLTQQPPRQHWSMPSQSLQARPVGTRFSTLPTSLRGDSNLNEVVFRVDAIGVAVRALDTDHGLLRVSALEPAAIAAGACVGELVLKIGDNPVDFNCAVEDFHRLVDDASRPTTIVFYKCPRYRDEIDVPLELRRTGALMKRGRGRSVSIHRPWQERYVEVRKDGTLAYLKPQSVAGAQATDPTRDEHAMPLVGCTVIPLNKRNAGRDFAFEVVAALPAAPPPPASPGREGSESGLIEPGSGVRDSMTLAAKNGDEGSTWIKGLQSVAAYLASATTQQKRERSQDSQKALRILEELRRRAEKEQRREAQQRAQEQEVLDMSLAAHEAEMAQKKREDEALMAMALQESQTIARQAEEEAASREVEERTQMLQVLFESSDMYAQEMHTLALDQKDNKEFRLAYDSFKLAVSFYLKALAIAEELGADHGLGTQRVENNADVCMRAADECFLKSQVPSKKKKKKKQFGGTRADSMSSPTTTRTKKKPQTAAATLAPAALSGEALQGNEEDQDWFTDLEAKATSGMDKITAAVAAAEEEEEDEGVALPGGWIQYQTEDGAPYYFHPETNVTQWLRPVLPEDERASQAALEPVGDLGEPSLRSMPLGLAALSRSISQSAESDGEEEADAIESAAEAVPSSFPPSPHHAGRSSLSSGGSSEAVSPSSPLSHHSSLSRLHHLSSDFSAETRGRVLCEIIESERVYCRTLANICKISNFFDSSRLSAEDKAQVFGSVDRLKQLNDRLLADLEKAVDEDTSEDLDGICIGRVLNSYIPFLKMYSEYSDGYNDALAKITELSGDGSTDFSKHVRTAMQENGISGEIQSLLIQPIQRIPRYKMLLERMIKMSATGHPDLPDLQKALTTVKDVADHVNRSLQSQEEQLKLLQLQNCFFPPVVLVRPGRRLIMQEELEKISAKDQTPQRYEVFLFNDCIIYGTKLFGGYYRFHRLITVTDVDPMPTTNHSTNRFKVIGAEKTVLLGARSHESKKKWLKALQDSMSDARSRAESFASAGFLPASASRPSETPSESSRLSFGFSWMRRSSLNPRPSTGTTI